MKGVPFYKKRYTNGVPFLKKMVHKRVRGWTSGRSLLSTPRALDSTRKDTTRLDPTRLDLRSKILTNRSIQFASHVYLQELLFACFP